MLTPDKGAVWFTDRRTRWLWDEDKGMAKKYLQAGRIRNAGVNTAADHKSLTRHRSYHWATEKYPLTSFTVVTQSGALADILDACVPQENPPPLRVRDPSLVDPPEVPILGVYMLFWDRQPCFFVKAVHPRGMVHGKDEPMGMLRLASPSSEYTERFNAALRPLAIISHLMCTLGLEPSAAADQVWAALLASPLWGQLGLDEGAAKAAIVELWPMIRHQLTLQFAITTEMPFLDDLSRLFEESRRVPALVAPPSCLGPRPTDEGSGTQPMEVEAVVADSSAGGGQQPVAAPSSPPAASHVLASATSQVEAGTTPSAASSVRGGSTEAPPSVATGGQEGSLGRKEGGEQGVVVQGGAVQAASLVPERNADSMSGGKDKTSAEGMTRAEGMSAGNEKTSAEDESSAGGTAAQQSAPKAEPRASSPTPAAPPVPDGGSAQPSAPRVEDPRASSPTPAAPPVPDGGSAQSSAPRVEDPRARSPTPAAPPVPDGGSAQPSAPRVEDPRARSPTPAAPPVPDGGSAQPSAPRVEDPRASSPTPAAPPVPDGSSAQPSAPKAEDPRARSPTPAAPPVPDGGSAQPSAPRVEDPRARSPTPAAPPVPDGGSAQPSAPRVEDPRASSPTPAAPPVPDGGAEPVAPPPQAPTGAMVRQGTGHLPPPIVPVAEGRAPAGAGHEAEGPDGRVAGDSAAPMSAPMGGDATAGVTAAHDGSTAVAAGEGRDALGEGDEGDEGSVCKSPEDDEGRGRAGEGMEWELPGDQGQPGEGAGSPPEVNVGLLRLQEKMRRLSRTPTPESEPEDEPEHKPEHDPEAEPEHEPECELAPARAPSPLATAASKVASPVTEQVASQHASTVARRGAEPSEGADAQGGRVVVPGGDGNGREVPAAAVDGKYVSTPTRQQQGKPRAVYRPPTPTPSPSPDRAPSERSPTQPSLPPSPPGAPRRDWGGSESPGEGPATPWETVGGGYGEEDRLDDGTGGEGGPASDSSPPGFEGMRRTRDLGAGEVVTGASGGNSAAVDKGAPPGGVSRPAKRKKGREGEARAGNKRPAPAVAERLSSGVEFISSLDEAGRHARLDHYKQEAKKVWTREVVLRRMRHLSSVYNIRLYGEGAVRRGEKVEAILKRTEGGEPLNEDDKRIVNTYLAPYLLKDRYTPFGRHFTLPNILGKIARHMLPFIRNGDTVVDFCCGANDFLHVLCQLCAATGLVDVTFIGYDIFPPGEKTAFFRRKDFLTVTWQEEGMPLSGDSLVMFSNPPFATAKSFLEHALGFDPRVLGIIIPEAEAMDKLGQNQLAKERGLYEEVETNTQLLMGNAFWIPGTSRYKGSVEPMADWNNTATWFRLFVKAHATGGDGVWSCNFDDVANADGIDAEEDRLAVPSGDSPLSGWQ
eukprot:jgi/Mesvir1/17812/Mv25366-RA.4